MVRTRWCCPAGRCGIGSWTIEHPEIAPAGQKLTTRAGRWATEQVGRYARSVSEVAEVLGTDWHTINDAVIGYGEALIDADVDRIGTVRALSLDETLFMRQGKWRTQRWSTQLVDARSGQLLEVVEGRDATAPAVWLDARDPDWLAGIRWAVMDMSGPYKAVFDTMLPDAEQVIDPFHVIRRDPRQWPLTGGAKLTVNDRSDRPCRQRRLQLGVGKATIHGHVGEAPDAGVRFPDHVSSPYRAVLD